MFLDLPKSAALRISTALLLALPLVGPAAAQTTKPAPQDEVQLDPVSVYADRQGAAVNDVPASVLVVEGADLQARGLTNMKDITRYMPGVSVPRSTSGANPYGGYTGFNIRGVGGNRVQMMVDGARTPEGISDGTRDYLDFSFTKQVDVVKGPASVLWGADALGGVVAVETIDPEDILAGADRGGIARLGHDGLTNEAGLSLAFAQRFGSDLSMMLGVSRSQGHEARLRNARADGGIWGCSRDVAAGATHCGELDPTDVNSTRLLAKAVWTPSDAHRLEFTFDALSRDTDVDVRWGLGRVISSNNGTIGDTLLDNKVSQDLKRRRLGVEHVWTLNQPWADEIRTTLSYSKGGYDRHGQRLNRRQNGDTERRADWLSYDEDFLELDVQLRSQFTTGAASHDLVWGFDGDLSKTAFSTRRVTSNLTTGIDRVETGVGFNFAGADTRRADLYVQDKITLLGGALELTPGLRYATYALDPRPLADYQVSAGKPPVKRKDEKLLKSLGALYRFGEGWQVWAHYGEGFKMPTAEQMFVSNPAFGVVPNPDLRPEYVESLEVGLRKEFEAGSFGVTAFQSDYDDFIKSLVPLAGGGYGYQNYNQVKVWGLELNGSYRFSDTLRFSGSAAWQRGSQVVSTTSAKTPFTVAPLQASLGLTYDLPAQGLSFDVVGNFASAVKRTASATNYKPAGYGVIDAFARWDVAPNAVLNLGVKNLFDKRYFDIGAASLDQTTSAGNAQTQPLELQTGAGRVFTVSLDMKF